LRIGPVPGASFLERHSDPWYVPKRFHNEFITISGLLFDSNLYPSCRSAALRGGVVRIHNPNQLPAHPAAIFRPFFLHFRNPPIRGYADGTCCSYTMPEAGSSLRIDPLKNALTEGGHMISSMTKWKIAAAIAFLVAERPSVIAQELPPAPSPENSEFNRRRIGPE